MVKDKSLRLTHAMAFLTIACMLIPVASVAQSKPLPEVPAALSPQLRESLEAERANLTALMNEYLGKMPAFNTECGTVPADASARIASCQSQLSALQREANSIKQKKSDFVARIAATVAAAAIATAAPIQTAVAAQNNPTVNFPTEGKKRTGAFGSNESNPDLEEKPKDPKQIGTNTSARDQLTSIAENAKKAGSGSGEVASERAREGFDTGTKKRGNLSDIYVDDPVARAQMPVIPPAMTNDRTIQEGLTRYSKVLPELRAAQKAVEQAQATSDKATTPAAKATAQIALNAAKVKSEGLQVAAESAIKQVEQRTVYLGKLPVFKAAAKDAKPPEKDKDPVEKK